MNFQSFLVQFFSTNFVHNIFYLFLYILYTIYFHTFAHCAATLDIVIVASVVFCANCCIYLVKIINPAKGLYSHA